MKMQVKTFSSYYPQTQTQWRVTRSGFVKDILDANRRATESAAEFASSLGPDRVVSVSASNYARMSVVRLFELDPNGLVPLVNQVGKLIRYRP